MSKRLDLPLPMVEESDGRPRAFRWRGRRIVVSEILDHWEEAGCWWRGEPARRVYRVQAAGGAIYELHHQPPAGWRLYRSYD
jgi:hypothetical protein